MNNKKFIRLGHEYVFPENLAAFYQSCSPTFRDVLVSSGFKYLIHTESYKSGATDESRKKFALKFNENAFILDETQSEIIKIKAAIKAAIVNYSLPDEAVLGVVPGATIEYLKEVKADIEAEAKAKTKK